MPIAVDIDVMLARRKMSVGELADRVGITPANLAVLKNGRAKAVRFATLAALCEVLECQPGDILELRVVQRLEFSIRHVSRRALPGPSCRVPRSGAAASASPACLRSALSGIRHPVTRRARPSKDLRS